MQDIYSYIPEKNHLSRVYDVAAVLWLQYMALQLYCGYSI